MSLTKKEFAELRKQGIIKKGSRWDSWKKKMKEKKYGKHGYKY